MSRLFDRLVILKPLDEAAYKKVIEAQVKSVLQERLIDPETGRNLGLIDIELTPAYRKYLFSETVIPSEGARNTVMATRRLLSRDLERALENIPKSSELSTQPLVLTLDFKPGTAKVAVYAQVKSKVGTEKPKEIFGQDVALVFPPLAAKGRMDPFRVFVGVHEFGHAYSFVRMGGRIEYATVISPSAGIGGYVRPTSVDSTFTAKGEIADLYSTLASRAMERIFLSKDPLSPDSVLDISPGSSNDIKQATRALWNLVYEYGLDPMGGVIERKGMTPMGIYAKFEDLPASMVDALGMVMKDLENYLVKDLLQSHPIEWYRDKIVAFARAGGVNEKEFYSLIGYPYPGDNTETAGESSLLYKHFGDVMHKPSRETQKARKFRQGQTGRTTEQTLNDGVDFFVKSLKARLHPDCADLLKAH